MSAIENSDALSIDVCICTYRRQGLVNTLASLTKLALPAEWSFRVIIADNDETPSARHIVENARRSCAFPIVYVHAPARNISIARNACLDAATAPLIAFIDDDERATPPWLAALVEQQRQSKADIVLGPVQSRYPAQAPAWLRREDFHSIKPVWVNGAIITGYTSNALLAREAASVYGRRFDPKLGRSGGEDTVFFSDIHKAGGRIDFAPTAIVTEDVAANRLSLWWLVKRTFRSGQTHGLLLLATGCALKTRLKQIALAFSKAFFCLLAALGSLLTGGRARCWLLRGTLHVGVVARLLGISELTQYG
jgi:succinoglycan biosynthesis protein ExoM